MYHSLSLPIKNVYFPVFLHAPFRPIRLPNLSMSIGKLLLVTMTLTLTFKISPHLMGEKINDMHDLTKY